MSIEVGSTVLITGLKSRPELNDTKGVVLSEQGLKGQRWVVELAADKSSLALKPTNLVLLLDEDGVGKQEATSDAGDAGGAGGAGGAGFAASIRARAVNYVTGLRPAAVDMMKMLNDAAPNRLGEVIAKHGKARVISVAGNAFAVAALVLYIAASTGFFVGVVAAAGTAYGAFMTRQGQEQLEKVGAMASGLAGRPVDKKLIGAAAAVVVAVFATRMLGGSGASGASSTTTQFAGAGMHDSSNGGGGGGSSGGVEDDGVAMTLQEAYLLGNVSACAVCLSLSLCLSVCLSRSLFTT